MDPKQQAEHLYLNTKTSQKDIAAQLGIDPKTLYRWMKEGHWRELKSATRRMPSVENIYAQLDDMNYNIRNREPGDRHPGKDESIVINRLINSIEKVKKQTSQGQNIEFLMNFINYIQRQNDELAKTLTSYGSAYLKGSEIKGFHPYDIEYGAEENVTNPSPRHCEESPAPCAATTKQSHDNTDILAPGTPWPTDPNCPNNTSPLHKWRGAGGEVKIGHDSGIPTQLELFPQTIENEQQTTQTPPQQMPEMPENNFPSNRAERLCEECIAPCPATKKQPSDDTIDPLNTQPPGPTPTAIDYKPPTPEERADPQYFVKQYMREQGIDPPEDYQLISIGEAVFRLKVKRE